MDSRKIKPPRNIKESKIWQQTIGTTERLWANYVNLLKGSFTQMPRAEQYNLITKLCQIITIGVTALATSFFYAFLPLILRVIALPVILVTAWWLGTKVIPNVIINKFEKYLNQE